MESKTLVHMFQDAVTNHGDKMALMHKVSGSYTGITYNEFASRVRQLSMGLLHLGMKSGDRIALMAENRLNWPIVDFGILSIGATNVPIYPTITPPQIKYILDDSESKIIFVSTKDLLEKVLVIRDELPQLEKIIYMEGHFSIENVLSFDELLSAGEQYDRENPGLFERLVDEVTPETLCGIIYTSGTTGNPKGVMLTHKNILSNVKASKSVLRVDSTDIFLSFLPLCHSFERMAGQFLAIGSGATIAFAENIGTVANNLLEVKPTLVTSVPRLFEKIYSRIIENAQSNSPIKRKIFNWAVNVGGKHMKSEFRGKISPLLKMQHKIANKLVYSTIKERVGGRLRFFVSGGAPLSQQIAEFFYKVGVLILEGYGLTESSPVISVNLENKFRFGSVGPAIPGVEIKIEKDGEILSRGPNIMNGYYKNPAATKEAIDSEGWLHTGDIGFIDEDGFLFITDRKKNILVTTGGKNVTPASIENLLITSPFIEQVMVLGDRQKFLTALIVPNFDSLKNYARENNIEFETIEDLVQIHEVRKRVDRDIKELSKNLARFEQIQKFTLLPKEFSIEDGELTPSLKIKRKVIEQKYADIIRKMY
ncbi:long-chain fatty acid--CoA ligase [candidate division KSB1 bacterium]|nr:long-chain fatty acid--CoA ligase [candidate division KSB1 bacterium]